MNLLMSTDPITCRPSDDVELAAALMARHRKSPIMCLDEFGRVAGIISLSDLARQGTGVDTLRAVANREARG